MTDPIDIPGLRALLAGATPGKWRLDETRASGELAIRVFGTTVSGFTAFIRPGSWTHKAQQIEVAANAALIVAAINVLPSLLSELEAARQTIRLHQERDAPTPEEVNAGWPHYDEDDPRAAQSEEG